MDRHATADDLQLLGATRIEALLVLHLLDHPTTSTAAIIDATGLRQPEVSVGMRALRQRGWVATKALPREGKGRPMHGYALDRTKDEILAHYQASGKRSLDAYASAIDALAALA